MVLLYRVVSHLYSFYRVGKMLFLFIKFTTLKVLISLVLKKYWPIRVCHCQNTASKSFTQLFRTFLGASIRRFSVAKNLTTLNLGSGQCYLSEKLSARRTFTRFHEYKISRLNTSISRL